MTFQDRMNAKFDASREKREKKIEEQKAKTAQLKAEAHESSVKFKEQRKEYRKDMAALASEFKESYAATRKKLNEDIAANHGKKPSDDGMVVTTANLGIRIVKLFFAGIFLVAFIYILVNMIF